MTTRETLKALIDELPEFLLADAARQIQVLTRDAHNPARRTLGGAPYQDEPLDGLQLASIQRTRIAEGPVAAAIPGDANPAGS